MLHIYVDYNVKGRFTTCSQTMVYDHNLWLQSVFDIKCGLQCKIMVIKWYIYIYTFRTTGLIMCLHRPPYLDTFGYIYLRLSNI